MKKKFEIIIITFNWLLIALEQFDSVVINILSITPVLHVVEQIIAHNNQQIIQLKSPHLTHNSIFFYALGIGVNYNNNDNQIIGVNNNEKK